MNKLEENKQNFCIDKNKQDIRRLEKMNRSQSEDIASLNQFKTKTNTDLSKIQTDLTAAKSDIEELKSAAASTEEKIELMSYDIIKVVDNTNCDVYWEPQTIFFFAQKGTKVKIRLKFDIINTFENRYCPITATTTIKLDNKEIFTQADIFTEINQVAPFDFEYVFTSNSPSHFLHIGIENSRSMTSFYYYTKPEFFTFEVFGTNVQIISRFNDFRVSSNDTKVLMTTSCIDKYARYSLQNCDENLTFDASAFETLQLYEWSYPNNLWPYLGYDFDEDGNIEFWDEPCLFWAGYRRYQTQRRIFYETDLSKFDSPDKIATMQITVVAADETSFAPTLKRRTNKVYPNVVYIRDANWIWTNQNDIYYIQTDVDGTIYADCAGVWRIDNFQEDVDILMIATRGDGTSFMFIPVLSNQRTHSCCELGFGTHVNAYLRADGSVEVFMRVGKDTKKHIIKKDEEGNYNIVSTTIIPDVQEYWVAPNNFHFERRGSVIGFYADGNSTPIATFETDN